MMGAGTSARDIFNIILTIDFYFREHVWGNWRKRLVPRIFLNAIDVFFFKVFALTLLTFVLGLLSDSSFLFGQSRGIAHGPCVLFSNDFWCLIYVITLQ